MRKRKKRPMESNQAKFQATKETKKATLKCFASGVLPPAPNPPRYIAFLQETHFIQKFETKYNTDWKGQLFHTFSDSGLVRVCQFILEKTNNVKRAIDGRKIHINVEVNG